MRLATYRRDVAGPARLGAVHNGQIVDIAELGSRCAVPLPDTMLDFIDLGPAAVEVTRGLLEERVAGTVGVARPLAGVELLAPIPRPRKNIWGIGLNYSEHVEESARSLDTAPEMPERPVIFSKPPTAVIGPGAPIRHNARLTQQLDWEIELAAVIGTAARDVDETSALGHVFGYTVLIDVSARDCRRAGQWIVSKGQDSFAPMGPWIVTADEIDDPHDLDLWLTKNDELKQSSNTRHMYFKIPALICDISGAMTLDPGDIIATGTPDGVGAGRSPQEWMWPGDVIVGCVEKIGTIRHPVVAAG